METPWSESMSESPPTPPRRTATTRLLFGDDGMMSESTVAVNASAMTPRPYLHPHPSHKRPGHPEDMWVSPHISPSLFKTIDGRTVYSMNPFSPMASSCLSATAQDKVTSTTSTTTKSPVPAFPVALSVTSSWDDGPTLAEGSLPRLERRDSTGFDLPQSSSALWTCSKVRRLTVETNDVGKGQPSQRSRYFHHDSNGDDDHHHDILLDEDRISPTDVTQFARRLPLPSTPAKAPRPSAMSYYYASAASTPPRTFLSTNTTTMTTTKEHPPQTPQLARRSMARLIAPTRSRSHSGSGGSYGSPGAAGSSQILHPVLEEDDGAIGTGGTTTMSSRFAQDFDVLEVLGQGSFGTVYKCLSRLDGCLYAIKTTLRPAKGHADRHRMFQEVYALAALSDHADPATFHIVRYHQAWMEQDCRLYIQTELCTCTLAQESQETLSVPRRYKLLREMCLALDFCHRHSMVHLDIKPDNIFVKNDQYKLGDFGLVSRYRTTHQIAEEEGEEEDKNEVVEEGDSRYMSRELLGGDWNDLTKCDIFSLGATMYQICIGRPLPANGPEWHSLRSADLSFDFSTALPTPVDLSAMIQEMMHPDPWQRPPAAQLLERKQLLSEERKALIAEQNKVREAAMALAETRRKLSQPKQQPLPPAKWPAPLRNSSSNNNHKGGLIRANTWNGGF